MDNTTMTLTDKQRHILRHSLGLTSPNRREYRNHFCTGPGSKDYSDCMALVESGHMTRRDGRAMTRRKLHE